MHHYYNIYPFSAIIGQNSMKEALILNAVNPSIGGVLIQGEKGTAKSTAARALAELLPDISAVKDCRFHCDPDAHDELCSDCSARVSDGEKLQSVHQHMRLVSLPGSVTEDRLVGTINLQHALEGRGVALDPGILAEVNRGILYIDEVNLLDSHVADLLLDAAAMGYNIIERENISYFHPSRFILIGTMNPEEGDLRPQLLDRFGLSVTINGEKDPVTRMQIVRARREFDADRRAFREKYAEEQSALRYRIVSARDILPKVTLGDDLLEFISAVCISAGVEGHRADITIARTAETLAALDEKLSVECAHVEHAIARALPHRVTAGAGTQGQAHTADIASLVDEVKKRTEKKKL